MTDSPTASRPSGAPRNPTDDYEPTQFALCSVAELLALLVLTLPACVPGHDANPSPRLEVSAADDLFAADGRYEIGVAVEGLGCDTPITKDKNCPDAFDGDEGYLTEATFQHTDAFEVVEKTFDGSVIINLTRPGTNELYLRQKATDAEGRKVVIKNVSPFAPPTPTASLWSSPAVPDAARPTHPVSAPDLPSACAPHFRTQASHSD